MTARLAGDSERAEHELSARRELRRMRTWGRWGNDDERGALNRITGDVVLGALRSARRGTVYPLGQEIRGGGQGGYHNSRPNRPPILRGRAQPQLFMSRDGGDAAVGIGPDRGLAEDTIVIAQHGTTTHVDALAHVWADSQLYNGMPSKAVRSYGAGVLGIENFGGLVTRGILLDVASYRGTDTLKGTDYITARDVDGCLAAENVEVREGDAVLVRTGWPRMWKQDQAAYGGLQPGVGSSGALALARRGIVLLGADNGMVEPYDGYDVSTKRALADPRKALVDLHVDLLQGLGIYLLELLDLEALASTKTYEFVLVVAPLRVKGATGSPVNPIAIA